VKEEVKRIIKMVEEGKLSAEDAAERPGRICRHIAASTA